MKLVSDYFSVIRIIDSAQVQIVCEWNKTVHKYNECESRSQKMIAQFFPKDKDL